MTFVFVEFKLVAMAINLNIKTMLLPDRLAGWLSRTVANLRCWVGSTFRIRGFIPVEKLTARAPGRKIGEMEISLSIFDPSPRLDGSYFIHPINDSKMSRIGSLNGVVGT